MPEIIPAILPEIIEATVDAASMAGSAASSGAGAAAEGLGEGLGAAGETLGDTASMTGGALSDAASSAAGAAPGLDTLGNAALVGGGLLQGAQMLGGLGSPKGGGGTLNIQAPSNPYNPTTGAGSSTVNPNQLAALAASANSNIGGIAPGYIASQNRSKMNALGMM